MITEICYFALGILSDGVHGLLLLLTLRPCSTYRIRHIHSYTSHISSGRGFHILAKVSEFQIYSSATSCRKLLPKAKSLRCSVLGPIASQLVKKLVKELPQMFPHERWYRQMRMVPFVALRGRWISSSVMGYQESPKGAWVKGSWCGT